MHIWIFWVILMYRITCPHCQKHQKMVKWPWCWCWLASKLTRPEHREYMGYCQEENEKQETKTCRWAEGHCQRNLGFTPPQQCHKLITSMPRRIEPVIKAKEPLPSIEYIYSKWTYFPEGQQFTNNVFFIGLLKYSNLLRVNWWVFVKCEPKSSQLKEPKT